MVYANKPATIDELRTTIERKISAVSADLWLKIVYNLVQRLDYYKRARGGHGKSSFIHNNIERTYTRIKNFIDIQNRFRLI